MPTPKLPFTKIRLSTSVSFYTLREDEISLASLFEGILKPRNILQSIQTGMRQMKGVVSFSESQERTPTTRYEIDSNVRGEPLEIMGSPPTRYLTLRRVVTYDSDFVSVLGYESELKRAGVVDASILSQQIKTPFIVIKHETAPQGSGIAATMTFYRGCLLTRLSREYTVRNPGGDAGVFEDATIYYATRQNFIAQT